MTTLQVKENYQITLPPAVRKRAKIAVGDIIKAEVKEDQIILTPRDIIDRKLAKALADVKAGRVYGPFKNAKEAIRFLHRKR